MEVAYEVLAAALETTRGTAVTPPTHWLPISGTMQPMTEWAEPVEQRGANVLRFRQSRTRHWSEWTTSGLADPRYLPWILNLITGPGVITTPTNGVLTRLHTHVPTVTSDVIKTATIYFGDPNIQMYRADFGFVTGFSLTGDASGTDGVQMTLNGTASEFFAATPTLPAQTIGSILIPNNGQIWIDDTFAIGTTEVTGRLISASLNVDTAVIPKFLANGPTTSINVLSYSRLGRGRANVSCTFQMEVPDTTQLARMLAATSSKVRIRFSGDQIEAVTPTYYEYVQWGVYGKLKFDGWSDLGGVNRTANFRIDTVYDSTLGADYSVSVQNQSATI